MKLPDSLLACDYIRNCQPVWLLGPAATGKTYICSKLEKHARIHQYSVLYNTARGLFRLCEEAERKGRLQNFLSTVRRANLIILDDFLLYGVTFTQAAYLFELLNCPADPEQPQSIVISTQLKEEMIELCLAEAAPQLAEDIIARLKAGRLVLNTEELRRGNFR